MQSTVLVALALAQSSALLAPRAPVSVRGVSLCSSPPELSYAADKAKDAPEEEITDASFVGQYELEEREDADSAKTLMELTADGKALLGSTDGIPFADSKGRWEYDGKELILELTRTFEDVKSTFSTTRVFIGDVIARNRAETSRHRRDICSTACNRLTG